jgi:lysozyme family protein
MAITGNSYSTLKGPYETLFASAVIAARWQSEATSIAKTINANKTKYDPVGAKTGVPWFFVGVVHSLECGLSFSKHLHNGDPLTGKTFQVPKNRPSGSPPFAWEVSAIDAIAIESAKWKAFATDWSIGATLFRLVTYNGLGYEPKGRENPYLWSGTQHWTKGKYTRDNYYDANFTANQQIGVATILKKMVELGILDAKSFGPGSGVALDPAYGMGCADGGAGGNSSLSMMNPQTMAEAVQVLLGLDTRAKAHARSLEAKLNPAFDLNILDLDAQTVFEAKGFHEDLVGDYTVDEVTFVVGSQITAILSAHSPDPKAPAATLFTNGAGAPADPKAPDPTAAAKEAEIAKKIYEAANQSKTLAAPSLDPVKFLNDWIFKKAGVAPITAKTVPELETALTSGRGKKIDDRGSAQKGDIVITNKATVLYRIGIHLGDDKIAALSLTKRTDNIANLAEYDKLDPKNPARIYRVIS